MDIHLKFGLAIDEEKNKICLLNITKDIPEQPTISTRIIPYKDILSVELFQNNTSVTKTVRSSQIGGAVVGGLLLGGTGAIIGGLSGKTETTEKVNLITLRLIVNDIKNPLHDIVFFNSGDSQFYKKKIEVARYWNGLIAVVIKRADEEEKNLQSLEQQKSIIVPNISVADEIKKLADLHNSGFLTLEEFQQQKTKLLGIVHIPKTIETEQTSLEIKTHDNPFCSKCDMPMQIRTAIKGKHQGKQFYVCSNYPNCRETYRVNS